MEVLIIVLGKVALDKKKDYYLKYFVVSETIISVLMGVSIIAQMIPSFLYFQSKPGSPACVNNSCTTAYLLGGFFLFPTIIQFLTFFPRLKIILAVREFNIGRLNEGLPIDEEEGEDEEDEEEE